MGKELYESSQAARELFEKADEILGFEISKIMFEGTDEELRQTKVTQPAVFLHSVAQVASLGEDFVPDMVAGHSLGEFSALVAAGALDFESGLRLVYARALAMQPEILCFDEPTSALDPELTGEVLRVIKGLKGGDRTMIVVTHEMEFARNVADVIIYMADGVIEEMGTPEQIFEDPQSEKTRNFLHGTQEKF